MSRRFFLVGSAALVFVLLLLAGCDDSSGYDRTYRATPTIPALTGPLQATADAIALERYATRSAAEVRAVEAQAQATAQAAIYAATVQAVEAQQVQERLWATQQAAQLTAQAQGTLQARAMDATMQAEAIRATQVERSYQATATAQALDRQATATADARYWQATQEAARATHQAQATADALAYQATATRDAWQARTTATAESAQATQQTYRATATRQAQQREVVLAYGRDYGIPVVLLILGGCLMALIVYTIRQHAKRPIIYPRNFLGDAEPMAVPMQGGGYTFVDLDRQPGPALQLLPDGQVNAPQLRGAGQEERTTARDQLVDMTSRPKLGSGKGSAGMPSLPMAPPPTPPAPGLRSVRVLRRLDHAKQVGFLPGPMIAALEADWEVEQ
jgi:hypothetical protein